MSNDNVPAAAEGMPAPMPRRNFLRGAALALAMPPVPLGLTPGSEINQLIAKSRVAWDAAEAAGHAAHLIWSRDDRPPHAEIRRSDIPGFYRPVVPRTYVSLHMIDELMDNWIEERRRHYAWVAEDCDGGVLPNDLRERRNKYIGDAEQVRQRLHMLFLEREAVYMQWSVSSGYQAAAMHADRLWNVFFDLQDAVVDYPCQTLADFAAKAAYVAAEFANDLERQHAFMLELGSLAGEELA